MTLSDNKPQSLVVEASHRHAPAMEYSTKKKDYFQGVRRDFIDRLSTGPDAALLEVGCGTGNTAALAKQVGKCGFAAGIEVFPDAAEEARTKIDEVLLGNVESVDLPWPESRFDILILSEVLEHLVDPWHTLNRMLPLLRPKSTVLASSPNISHWSIIRELITGDWTLTDAGVKDRTHLRWFTPRSFCRLFTESGYTVQEYFPLCRPSWKARTLTALTAGRLEHLFISQVCVQATVAE